MQAEWLICSNRWQPLSMLSAARSCRRSRYGAAGDEAECEPVRRDGMAYEVGADGLAEPGPKAAVTPRRHANFQKSGLSAVGTAGFLPEDLGFSAQTNSPPGTPPARIGGRP
jgi:hypothetical protein